MTHNGDSPNADCSIEDMYYGDDKSVLHLYFCWVYPKHSVDVEAPTGLANILIKMKEGEHDNSRMMVVRLTRSVFLAGCSSGFRAHKPHSLCLRHC